MKKILIYFFTAFLFACNSSQDISDAEKVEVKPEFSKYISAFTGGVVSSDGAIKVQLASAPQTKISDDDLNEAFKIFPQVKGKTVWVDERTVEFIPFEALKPGLLYRGQLKLNEFLTVDEGLETFEFNFRVQRASFKFKIEEFQSYTSTDFTKQRLLGEIILTNPVDSIGIKDLLKATQDGESLKTTIEQQSKLVYNFSIDNIIRGDKRSDLLIEWNGAAIGIEKKGSKKIKIPSKNEFVILDVEVNHSPQQYVKVHFSDPINTNQFLEGLIYLKNHDVSIVAQNQYVILYPEDRIIGTDLLKVELGIENKNGKKLSSIGSYDLNFEDVAPDLRLLGEGNIVPKKGKAHFPFESINLTAVDITITKIFEDNIIQFLQVNDYDGTYQLRRVSREVHKERVELDAEGMMDLHHWNKFSIDLNKYIQMDPGAIYRVQLSANKEYSLFDCTTQDGNDEALTTFAFTGANEEWNERGWDGGYYYSDDYYYDYNYYDYDSKSRKDPCKDYFYRNKKISRNILISDIAIMAKAGADKELHVILSDLNDASPISGATLKFYDYQQQYLGEAVTDAEGMSVTHLDKKPFVIIAANNDQKGYLKLRDGESLSLSKFDVSGEEVQQGVKGFIYGDRGVWRPGDSIYVSFILEDKASILPATHPVKFQLINPKGVVVDEKIRSAAVNNIYDFRTSTLQEDITGNYRARVIVGNRNFYKTLKIESVKPNRLKVDLTFSEEQLGQNSSRDVNLNAKWLHGAIAGGLKAKVDVHLASTRTTFTKFSRFTFDDPLKDFKSEDKTIFEGKLDEDGSVTFDHGILLSDAAPGMLKAYFTTKVFENGGDFSIDRSSTVYSPYSEYAGVSIPEGDLYGDALVTDKNHEFDIVTVNESGKLVSSEVNLKVYKLNWRWWWDSYDNDLASYISRSSTVPIDSKNIKTVNGKATYDFQINQPNWGRYLVLVKDKKSGHITGKTIYVDWPYQARSNRNNSENSTMLAFSTDKEKYKTGEMVTLSIPTPEDGKALISIEGGTKIIDKFWIETSKGETTCEFVTTDEMDPNVFVHVSLIQPYNTTKNDLPIRMYGVVPIFVEDPLSHLSPTIKMESVLRPESKTTIKINEANNKPMTYTIAIVDEGLLDLTNFKTPDPWKHFNAKEALGVKTWDMYDYVLGAYGDQLDKLLAIGGDGSGDGKKALKANRFKPMVKFIGPFEYTGETRSHTIEIPNYVGSVRVMVVAEQNGAYGNAEKTVPVRNPLMVLGTLPRVVGPGEEIVLPVDVFAMEKHVKNVSVTVKTNNMFSINGGSKKTLSFSKIGDKIVDFNLTVGDKIGVGKISIVATSGKEKATYDFEIDVRTPNSEQTVTVEKLLDAGESFNYDLDYFGIDGTNQAYLEVSNFPPIDLGRRLDYLIKYPHGCIEQTTSSVFPQLYLSDLMELNQNRKIAIQQNINSGINKLKSFQTSSGGFSYWPGGNYDNEWGTNYAGHFMIEAENKGFVVASSLKKGWLKFQRKQAKNWNRANNTTNGPRYSDLIQAYRLFTLALAGKAELGLMNRLRERNDLSLPGRWRLAAAYKLAGQQKVAEELIKNQATLVPAYVELSYTFGSNVRDEAMILETLVLLGKRKVSADLAIALANRLNKDTWMSTQTTAFALLAVSKFVGNSVTESKLKFTYKIDGQGGSRDSEMRLVNFDLRGKTRAINVKNTGKGILYARLITTGIPLGGEEIAAAKNIVLKVEYFDMKNKPINVDEMIQGKDFIAEISVSNPGVRGHLKELVLSHIAPSGWEIHNTRMDEHQSNKSAHFTYQDIRDDRVYTYFNLGKGKRKIFRLQLNASYLGKFYRSGISVEAMYDNSIYARVKGGWVNVKKEKDFN